jgi:hypothetical protein
MCYYVSISRKIDDIEILFDARDSHTTDEYLCPELLGL